MKFSAVYLAAVLSAQAAWAAPEGYGYDYNGGTSPNQNCNPSTVTKGKSFNCAIYMPLGGEYILTDFQYSFHKDCRGPS